MYKRFSLSDLKNIHNNVIANFFSILKREHCQLPGDLFKKLSKEGQDFYYFTRGDSVFRISYQGNNTILIDEKEKIELFLDEENKKLFNSMVKNFLMKKNKPSDQKTIEQILMEVFSQGMYNTIFDKPYMVYDIETTSNVTNLRETKFLIAYAMEPQTGNKMSYEYIDQEKLKKFVQKMIDFDGYIIGFNSIAFDNPVCIYNAGLGQKELDIINNKSIDLFLFMHKLTGKRIGLNKIATALVGVQKTLESGLQGEVLWKEYEKTGDTKHLDEFKKYCKNDVRMTALVLFYLLHYQKVFMDGEEITFDKEKIIEYSQTMIHETSAEVEDSSQNSLFI